MNSKVVFLPKTQSNVPVVLVDFELHAELLLRPTNQLVQLLPCRRTQEEGVGVPVKDLDAQSFCFLNRVCYRVPSNGGCWLREGRTVEREPVRARYPVAVGP